MKMCRFSISDQVFCLFSLVQVYCCEYNKKFWNSQPKIAIFWKYKNMLMSAHILGIFFLKWLLNLCYPLQKTVVPQNILILPPNIENKWKKSFLEQSKLCPCWGTVGGSDRGKKRHKGFLKRCLKKKKKPYRIIPGPPKHVLHLVWSAFVI